jgi:hypothetical protein
MNKKEDNPLGLTPFGAPTAGLSFGFGSPYLEAGRELTRDERRILDQFHKKKLVIDLTDVLTQISSGAISDIYQCSATTYDETAGYIENLRLGKQRSKEHQAFVDAFSHQLNALLGHHLGKIAEIGAERIGAELYDSLNVPPEQRSFLQRLLGEGD